VIGALLGLSPQEAADKLTAGEIDIAIMVSGWDSPVVRRLMEADGIAVASVPRPDALVALYPFLNKVVLPAGVAGLSALRRPAAPRRRGVGGAQGEPGGARRSVLGHPVSSAQRRGRDSLPGGDFPQGRPVSRGGSRRPAAQRGGTALLQKRPAGSSVLSS